MVAGFYRAVNVTQKDGSKLQWSNCRMAAIATMLDFHTEGAKKSTGAKMRSYQDDQVGGTDASDARTAWERGYHETLVIRDGRYWEDLVSDRANGWFVTLDVWYASLPERCQASGQFGHTIGISPETLSDGQWLVGDPLCNQGDWNWMRPADLRVGAEEWGKRILNGGSGKTHGPEGIDEPGDTGGAVPIRYTTAVEVAPVLKVVDPKPVLLDIPVGTQMYYHTGQPYAKATQASSQIYSPFATLIGKTVAGRAVYRTVDGVKQLALARTVDCKNINPVPVADGPDPDTIINGRDAQWIDHLTPPK
jgi:hypothetical protein